MGITVAHWNCQGLKDKIMLGVVDFDSFDVLCVQESFLRNHTDLVCKDFALIRKDISSPGNSGICMLIRNNLEFARVNLDDRSHSSLEIQGITLFTRDKRILIVNIYRHPHRLTPSKAWERIFELQGSFPEMIVVGDFNAHHSLWHNSFNDAAGLNLERAAGAHNFMVLNEDTCTLLPRPNQRKSVIDLSWVSCSLALRCRGNTGEDCWGSDHFPVFVSIDEDMKRLGRFVYKLKLKKVHKKEFTRACDMEPPSLAASGSCTAVDRYHNLTQLIMCHLEKFFPMDKCHPRTIRSRNFVSASPWWNETCKEAVEHRKEVLREYKAVPTLCNLEKYRVIKNRCNKLLKREKRKGWKTLCDSFNEYTPSAKVWALAKLFKKRRLCTDNKSLSPSELAEMHQVTIAKLCPPGCTFNGNKPLDQMKREDAVGQNPFVRLDDPIELSEVQRIIDGTNTKAAAGLDQIDNDILRLLPAAYVQELADVLEGLFRSGEFPAEWQESLVVFIPKPHGGGVRPIALLSHIFKVLEKIIYLRLQWYAEHEEIIPPFQFGFRAFKSCNDALVTLTSFVHDKLLQDCKIVCLFIDVQGAFDNVDPSILIQELLSMGVPACTRKFIANSVFERRNYFISAGELLGPFLARKGTPQGSILSPLLFNLYLRDIGSCLTPDVHIVQYADDITIFSADRNLAIARRNVQSTLLKLHRYLQNKGLDISPNKSQSMVFGNDRRAAIFLPLRLLGVVVPVSECVRFLGIYLDNQLKGREHFKFLYQKGKRIVDIVASLAGVWWGSHPQSLLTIYRSMFRSCIEYGCSIFNFKGNLSIFCKIQRLQFKAIRVAYGYRISTPINVMLCEAQEPPLRARIAMLSRKFIYKCLAIPTSIVTQQLNELKVTALSVSYSRRVKVLSTFPLLKYYLSLDYIARVVFQTNRYPGMCHDTADRVFIPNIDIRLHQLKKKNKNNPSILQTVLIDLINNDYPNHICIFTDGSVRNQGDSVGIGMFIPLTNLSDKIKLPAGMSIFSAEAWAVLHAIRHAVRAGWSRALILTDSLSVLRALRNHKYKKHNYIIADLRAALRSANREGFHFVLAWVPAHINIYGNERADQAAKEATRLSSTLAVKVPHTDFFADAVAARERIFLNYLKENCYTKGKMFGRLYMTYNCRKKKPWFYRLNLEREQIVTINRIRSDHYNLAYSLHRKNMVACQDCHCGEGREDINHVIFYCPLYRSKAVHLIKFLKETFPDAPISIFHVLVVPTHKLCRLICAFLGSCDLRI